MKGHLSPSFSSGQSIAELAVLMPILFLILFGVLDFGRLFYYSIGLTNAAREGARVGMDSTVLVATVRAAARNEAVNFIPLTDADIAVLPDDGGGSRTSRTPVTVTARYSFTAATPLIANIWGGGPLVITRAAVMQVY